MKKIIVLGSLNKDIVSFVNNLPSKGETIESLSLYKYNGGKGGNQAVAIKKIGAPTSMIAAIGNDKYGEDLLSGLNLIGIDTKFIFKKESNTSTAFINVDKNGDNTIVVSKGSNNLLNESDIEKSAILFNDAKIFVTQLEIEPNVVEKSLKLAKGNNMTTVLTPAPANKFDINIMNLVDILIPNESEFEEIFNLVPSEENFICISRKYENTIIIITLGAKGVAMVQHGKLTMFNSKKVSVVDTTSAGDSFVGGFINYISREKSINESIKFGIKAASITVTKKGAQASLPTFNQIVKKWGK